MACAERAPVDPWCIRPARHEDTAALCKLFEEVFGRPLTAQQWRHKLAAFDDPEAVLVATVDHGAPIFQYAGIPRDFSVLGRPQRAMLSVDTMGSPRWRRRGLLSKVGAEAYARWRAAGVDFVLGLPNEQWGSRAEALGWRPLFDLCAFSLPVAPSSMLLRKVGAGGSLPLVDRAYRLARGLATRGDGDGVEVSSVTSPGAEFSRLGEQLLGDDRIGGARGAGWLQWRYLDDPVLDWRLVAARRGAELLGWAAWRLHQDGERRVVVVGELLGEAGSSVAGALVRALQQSAIENDAEAVVAWAADGSGWAGELAELGFLLRPTRFAVQYVPLNNGAAGPEFADPARWLLHGGDFDVV